MKNRELWSQLCSSLAFACAAATIISFFMLMFMDLAEDYTKLLAFVMVMAMAFLVISGIGWVYLNWGMISNLIGLSKKKASEPKVPDKKKGGK